MSDFSRVKLITGAVIEPVDIVADVPPHIREYAPVHTTELTSKLTNARQDIEDYLSRALLTSTWDYYLDEFPSHDAHGWYINYIELPKGQLQSVTSVKYTPDGGVETTWASSNYEVDTVSEPGRIVLKRNFSWPGDALKSVNGLVIRFIAGYTSAALVPAPIKGAILNRLGSLYMHREDMTDEALVLDMRSIYKYKLRYFG